MDKLISVLEKYLLPISEKISSNKSLQAVSRGFLALLPVTIVGSIAYLVANFPIQAYLDFVISSGVQKFIMIPYYITLGLMSLYTVFLVAYNHAQMDEVDPLSTGLIALLSFFILTPFVQTGEGHAIVSMYNFDWLGAKGLFVSLIVALLVSKFVSFIVKKDLVIKMPDGVPPYVTRSFAALIPALASATVVTVIAALFGNSSYGSIHELVFKFLQGPLLGLGSSFTAYIIATVLIQLLWWFGIHGFNVVGSVMIPIWIGLDMQRLADLAAGQPVSTYMGMSFLTAVGQSTLAILLTVYLFSKSSQLKNIAKVGMPAALFNIGEPMVFGLPTVLNPIMFIPTVLLIPIVTNVFFYLGFTSGLVPALSGAQIPMQMPVVLYGIVQGNWMLALWQLLAIPLAMALIYPFVRLYDKQILRQEGKE